MTPLALDSTNQYEVFVNISQHQSDKPWSETRGTCLPGLISCCVRTMNQVILCNPEEKQQLWGSRGQVVFILVLCLFLSCPVLACHSNAFIVFYGCIMTQQRKSGNGAHRGIWSHQISVMYSAPYVAPLPCWDDLIFSGFDGSFETNRNLRLDFLHL